MDTILGVLALIGLVVAIVTFALNSQTPVQLGPVPFFGGAILFLVCGIMFLARVAVGK